MDANLCVFQVTDEIAAPEIPLLMGQTEYIAQLGCEVPLDITLNNISTQNIQWTDATFLTCDGCLDPIAVSLETVESTVFVTSQDGCSDSLTVFIEIEKLREFYAPNVFSPNFDGINDTFYLIGGKEVASIDLSIFNRWGGHIYKVEEMPPNNPMNAWDGSFKGELMETGVYVWKATIHFIDGYSEVFGGDILLLR